mmetsp:Transcript_16295/g.35981  ORF Transcript_16295/g.35981 Transcript_16295/m.35981 type:complete len:275 (+) Transcript_16295:1104-1928(+)
MATDSHLSRTSGATFLAGTSTTRQIESVCIAVVAGYARVSPVVDRTTITATSLRKSIHPSAYSASLGRSDSVRPRSDSAEDTAASSVDFRTVLPRPSYAPLRDLSMRGSPNLDAASCIDWTDGRFTYGGRGMEWPAKCSFCANLSWMILTTLLDGWTFTPSFSSSASPSTPTCSISIVTTSHPDESSLSFDASWSEPPTIRDWPPSPPSDVPTTCVAGESGPEPSRKRIVMLSRGASRDIIRPSCPPPTHPTRSEVGDVGRLLSSVVMASLLYL